ncbi:MAG: SIMPL domain-containing protein [Pelolinea sp.]|nr:SIMPL domain-containing protein [Pelolinea sp.]
MKKIMGIGFVLGALSLALSSCSGAGAAVVGQNGEPAVITVTGSGEAYVVPDIGYINVGVRYQGATVTEAIAVNNELARSIQASLIDQGIDEKDIQTSNFNVYQQSDYDYQGNPTSTYYMVENTVYVTVRQIESMGEVLDAVARGGANIIYGVNFDVQDKSKALSTARKLAVQSAQVQAQELALAAGVELGDLISIDSSFSSAAPFYGYGLGGGGGVAESVPVASGQISVSAQVQMTFIIQ